MVTVTDPQGNEIEKTSILIVPSYHNNWFIVRIKYLYNESKYYIVEMPRINAYKVTGQEAADERKIKKERSR